MAAKMYLFPDNAPLGIIDVMHLIKDDPLDVTDDVSALVEHRAQDLRRHDQAGRLGLDADIAGQEPDLDITKASSFFATDH
jgi:hypothetical protein